MSRSTILAAILALVASSPAGKVESVPSVPKPGCDGFEAGVAMRDVEIAGEERDDVPYYNVRLRFPRSDTARYDSPTTGQVQDAALLELSFAKPRDLSVMFHDRRSINEIVPISIAFRTETPKEGVEAYRREHSVVQPNGLTEIEGTRGGWEIYSLYVNGSPERWKDMITCFKPGTAPFPNCTHYFDYKNIDVEVDYSLADNLANWREIRRYVEHYVACAYVGDAKMP